MEKRHGAIVQTPCPSEPVSRSLHGLSFMSESTPSPHFVSQPLPHDSELENSVRSSLQQTGYQQLRRLDVAVEDGRVRITGRLPQFYLMQLAQQAVMKTKGVVNLDNGIQVVRN